MITLLDPPAGEPVSPAELKAHLRVTHALEDDLLQALLVAARERLEAALGVRLVAAAVSETFDTPPVGPSLGLDLALGLGPVLGVDAVAVADGLGGWTGLDPARWRWTGERPGRVRLRVAGPVRVDYRAGLAADPAGVPASLRQAVLVLAADAYERRDDPSAPEPPGLGPAEPWAAPFRRARL